MSLVTLAAVFFRLGATTFGGMWGASQQLEDELVARRRWCTAAEFQFLLVAATLIPGPKFMALGGLVGYRLRGWLGSTVAVFGLLLPGAIMVLLAVALVNPGLLHGPLAPLQRTVDVAVVGILLGSARRQFAGARPGDRRGVLGLGLSVAVALALVLGAPLLAVAAVAFGLGPLLIRGEAPARRRVQR